MRPTLFLSLAVALSATAADRPVSFSKDVQPILAKNCWSCHGSSVRLSKLSLASREDALKGGEHGAAIVPGSAEKSRLYRLAAALDKPSMPIGGKLSAEDAETLRIWIDQGAAWDASAPIVLSKADPLEDSPIRPEERNYWAFKLPVRPPVPAGDKNAIDAFLRSVLAKKGIAHAPEADKTTLLRRAYFDLLGIPPTPAEAAQFLNDTAPLAWERLIDRLLASPHYGERWGRHWLDVARYADSNGFEHDFDRPNAWRYRDYVIRAFNENKPYDQFLREQIAGDEIPTPTYDSQIATGFLRSYAKVGFREKDNPEFRYEYLDDMIATIGRGVLGLTVQCARCHDHKFDPIRQADYYRMQSSLWGYVEVDQPLAPKADTDAWRAKNAEVDAKVNDLKLLVKALEKPYRDQILPAKYKKFPKNVQDAIAVPETERTPGQTLLANQVIRTVNVSDGEIDRIISTADKAEKQRIQGLITQAEKQRPKPLPLAMAVTDGDYRFTPDGPGDEPAPGKGKGQYAGEGSYIHNGDGKYAPPPSYFKIRGDVNSQGPETRPGFVKVATHGTPATELPTTNHTSGRRLALAEWLVSKDNPLTARVAVNRIWYNHFGSGIAATVDNFGKMGEVPSNPELLDWLAVEFRESGWDVKKLHRLIMTSETYKMASQFPESPADPDGRLLARFPTRRLDAESIRDTILATSGALNPEMYGKPIFPTVQKEVLHQVFTGIWKQQDTEGPEAWRRSVYVYRKRGMPLPMLDAFDLPNQNISCGVRNVSTVPTQALALMNDDFVLRQAELLAARIQESAPSDVGKQVDAAYRIALTRPPTEAERQMALSFLGAGRSMTDFANVILNLNEFLYIR